MRAVLVEAPGGVEKLVLGECPDPVLAPGCIAIDVRAAALNRADLLQRRGLYPPPPGASDVLGLECAGVVREVAPDVQRFRPGDRVMALLAGGGYAERVVCPEAVALPIPERLSFEQAAAIPEAFLTAHEALFTLGRLAAGEHVLVHAAASGVGSAALQLARLVGAHAIATASSPDKLALAKRVGATRAVSYREVDFSQVALEATAGAGVDVALDFVGGPYAAQHSKCLATGGRWIVIGLLGSPQVTLDFGVVLRRRLQILGLVMRTRSIDDKRAIVQRFSERFLAAFASGELSPVVDRVYPLSEVRAAHERMEQNLNLGKIVLSVGEP